MKLRKVGAILLDMEPLLEELVAHELQHGDIMSLVHVWLTTHAPDSIEEYLDGSSPSFFYGYKE